MGRTNELVVRVGAHPGVLPETVSGGTDFEKNRWTPGIYDSVSLVLSDNPAIETVQVAPQSRAKIVVQTKLRNYARSRSTFALTQSRARLETDAVAASAPADATRLAAGEEQTITQTIAIPDAKLWTPETAESLRARNQHRRRQRRHPLRHARVSLRHRRRGAPI